MVLEDLMSVVDARVTGIRKDIEIIEILTFQITL
jgi:hypothetical protein